MEDKLKKELSKFYNDIEIPKDDLDKVIKNRLHANRKRVIFMYNTNDMKKKKKVSKGIKGAAAIAASLVLVFGVTVNVSQAAAEQLYKVPVVGSVAKLITFRDYSFETDTTKGEVTIPNVDVGEGNLIEDKINVMIKEKVDASKAEQEKLDEEYKQAFLETGGKEEDFRKVEMTIDYEKYFATDKVISFDIHKYQTLAPAYNEVTFYNIDLETGEDLTLSHVLGEDFATTVKDTVLAEMNKRMENEDEDITYDVDYFKDMEINNDRKFYINEEGNIVVVFDKYEVAAGVFGQQEFVVGQYK